MAATHRRRNATSVRLLVAELRSVAEQLGYTVREEKLLREVGYRVRGGGCVVRGTKMIFLDREATPEAQLDVLVDVLSDDAIEQVYMSPHARNLFRQRRLRIGGTDEAA
ncbi:MAG: hypothetical protein N3C12_06790 [Candidatus Binatia bacterium]|nr:hypothetical protein [Candidatus Binatia bacterium]